MVRLSAFALAAAAWLAGAGATGAAEPPRWLGDDLPLPLPVKTPQDVGFKAAAERQYLIFNLMAGGKLAYQRGDYATAVDKWESLLRMGGLDPLVEKAVTPFLTDARAKAAHGGGRIEPKAEAAEPIVPVPEKGGEPRPRPATAVVRRSASASVSGIVSGGGQIGPGGAVLWLKRLDGPMPRISPPTNQVVTQREKTFLPHVLAVPLGTSVQFRNDDRIYHNVFSIAKPNDFDAGIRATGATYTRTFNSPGAVEILCNIHSTMNGYVFVVDSPLYAKAQASGAFSIRGVAPGRYELGAWHEAASSITRKQIVVGSEGAHDVTVTVGGDKRPAPFVPDKYGTSGSPSSGTDDDRRRARRRCRMSRPRLAPLVAAIAVLALTAGAVVLLSRLDRAHASERVAAEAQAAALRAADGVRGLLGTLEGQTQNATANPRLVAALDANVDEETLRDLLLTEPWWDPFRRAVDGFGLYGDESTPLVTSRLPASFDVRTMVRYARQTHHASSQLLVAAGQVQAVSACPITLTGRSEWPVLVSTRIVDVGLLSGMAERAGGAVAISDGKRLLVAATTGGATGADDLSALKQAIDLAAPGLVALGAETVAALPLTGGLQVLVGVAAPISAPGGLPLPGSALAILAIGLVFSIGLYVILSRQRPEPPAAEIVPATDPDAALLIVGRYSIVERIGQGGMAEIYAAVTAGEGGFRRPVVIKRLRPELAIDANAVAQFCDEANLLAALHHPNIVAVHDFGRAQGQYYLAEEYVVGRDLGRLVEQRFARGHQPPPVEVIAYVAVELLKALEYAHGLTNELGRSLGIVHRDISPENVMVSARGEVKLLDFGVVKTTEGGRLTRTEVGVVKGNVTYMAPEQARGLDVDHRADLFSVALVIYMLATGQPLYTWDTTYGLLMKAGAGPGVEDRVAIRELPHPLAAVVDRATATRIEDRYPNARAMAADLEAAARNGAAATATLVVELCGTDLRQESHRMATFTPQDAAAPPVVGLSSG